MKFYYCPHCGNIVIYAKNKGVPVVCCGDEMIQMLPNITDASHEEHLPVITASGNQVIVKIGEKQHPMSPAHYIEGIILETTHGFQRHDLEPIIFESETCFLLCTGEKPVAAYAYCNQHKLWKAVV